GPGLHRCRPAGSDQRGTGPNHGNRRAVPHRPGCLQPPAHRGTPPGTHPERSSGNPSGPEPGTLPAGTQPRSLRPRPAPGSGPSPPQPCLLGTVAMHHPGILSDLTEFLREPMRSGIQRVSFELVRHWCAEPPLVPIRIGPDRTLLVLPEETI